jgi:hypothetical protein
MMVTCKANTHIGLGSTNESTILVVHCIEVDILGPFSMDVGEYRHLYVAIDKFTKWAEATQVVNITQGSTVAFLKSIVYGFDVSNCIIVDNGAQCKSWLFRGYCEDIGKQLRFASVASQKQWSSLGYLHPFLLQNTLIRTFNSYLNTSPSIIFPLFLLLCNYSTYLAPLCSLTELFSFYIYIYEILEF